MEPRERDLQGKVDDLTLLLERSGDPRALFEAAEATALALEFRATDSMIGISEISSDLVEEAETLVTRARERAAEGKVPEACVQLAEGIWLARDETRAERAVDFVRSVPDEPHATYLWGLFAFNGFGCEKDLKQSLSLHEQAAKNGHADAMFELHAMYARGIGCDADPVVSLEWCEKAAHAGNARAMANLGGFYATGRGGLPLDSKKSVEWYDRAANAGHGKAAATLGIMYALGSGAPSSISEAHRYFAKADDLGFDWRGLAETAGVDLADLYKVTLRPPPPPPPPADAKKGESKRRHTIAETPRAKASAPPEKPAADPEKHAAAEPKAKAAAKPEKKAATPKAKAAAKPEKKAATPKAKAAAKPEKKAAAKPEKKAAAKPEKKAAAKPKAKVAAKPKAKVAAKPKAKAVARPKAKAVAKPTVALRDTRRGEKAVAKPKAKALAKPRKSAAAKPKKAEAKVSKSRRKSGR
jgi:TPR repeat protein